MLFSSNAFAQLLRDIETDGIISAIPHHSMLCRLHDASEIAGSGAPCVVAGSSELLRRLPQGNWIGGTSSFAFTPTGGVELSDRLIVTAFPPGVRLSGIQRYGVGGLEYLADDCPAEGFSVVIIPHCSPVHSVFARDSAMGGPFEKHNIFGWMSGSLRGRHVGRPQVYFGPLAHCIEDEAVAMHFDVEPGWKISTRAQSIYKGGTGQPILFPSEGFSATHAIVDGHVINFAQFIAANGIDITLPLVSSHGEREILTCISSVDPGAGVVRFHAPVFRNVEYRFAAAVHDPVAETRRLISEEGKGSTVISCLCLLSYNEGAVEDYAGSYCEGPVTFGEIAPLPTTRTFTRVVIERC